MLVAVVFPWYWTASLSVDWVVCLVELAVAMIEANAVYEGRRWAAQMVNSVDDPMRTSQLVHRHVVQMDYCYRIARWAAYLANSVTVV